MPLSSSGFLSDKISVGFCDSEKSVFSSMISNLLVTDKKYTDFMTIEALDYQSALEKVESGAIDAAIVLPERFVADMTIGINRPITVVCNESNPLNAAIIKELMESAAAQISAAQSAINTVWFNSGIEELSEWEQNSKFNSLVMNYMAKALDRDMYYTLRNVSAYGGYGMAHFFAASAIPLFVFLSCIACARPIIQNQSNLHQRLRASGHSHFWIALQGLLPLSLISSAQALLILFILKVLSMFEYTSSIIDLSALAPPSAPATAITAVSVCFLASSIVYFTCLFFKNTESVEIFSISFIFVSAIIGGTVIPYAYLPGFIEKLGVLSFNRLAQRALLSSAFEGGIFSLSLSAVAVAVAFLLLICSSVIIKRGLEGKRWLGAGAGVPQ